MEIVKNYILIIVFLFPAQELFAQNMTMPEGIKEYYNLYNFISTKSTKEERDYLTSLRFIKDDTITLEDKRLIEINNALDDLGRYVFSESNTIPNKFDRNIPVQVYPEIIIPSELFEKDGRIIIKNKAYSFGKETNLYFIRDYEKNEGEPLPDIPEYDIGKLKLSRQEHHEWFEYEGKWRKSSVNKILIDN